MVFSSTSATVNNHPLDFTMPLTLSGLSRMQIKTSYIISNTDRAYILSFLVNYIIMHVNLCVDNLRISEKKISLGHFDIPTLLSLITMFDNENE